MKVSLRTDVTTSGAHEGLIISTGFFTTGKEGVVVGTSPNGLKSIPFRQFPPSFCDGSPAALLVPQLPLINSQNAVFNAEAVEQNTMTTGGGQLNAEYQPRYYEEMPSPLTNVAQSMPNDAEITIPETKTIKLNLFGNDAGESSNNNKKNSTTAELVPLMRCHSMGPQDTQTKCQKQSNGGPLLCDTTTTRTTVEVFRANPDNAHFFQIPKGPLSTAKQSVVELIPVEGPNYERMDRSETQFSERTNSPRYNLATPKMLQWHDSLPTPSAPLFGQREFAAESFAPPFSPPRQCSTPLHFESASDFRHSVPQMGPISPPLFARLSADNDDNNNGLTTVLRRQQCDKSERFLRRQRKIDVNSEKEEAKVPPRPPKCRDKRVPPFGEDRKAPPRPPKQMNNLRKSQSAGFINQNMTQADVIRTTASDNNFKLYQTRDCLGRIVCEW